MKKNPHYLMYVVLFSCLCLCSSCEAIQGIFKAGVWTGVLLVVGVIALVIFLFTRKSKK